MDDFHEKSGSHYNPSPTPSAARPPQSTLTRDEYRATLEHMGIKAAMGSLQGALDEDELGATRKLMAERPTQMVDLEEALRLDTLHVQQQREHG